MKCGFLSYLEVVWYACNLGINATCQKILLALKTISLSEKDKCICKMYALNFEWNFLFWMELRIWHVCLLIMMNYNKDHFWANWQTPWQDTCMFWNKGFIHKSFRVGDGTFFQGWFLIHRHFLKYRLSYLCELRLEGTIRSVFKSSSESVHPHQS